MSDEILEQAVQIVEQCESDAVRSLLVKKLGPAWSGASISEYDLYGDDMHLWIAALPSKRDDDTGLVQIVPVIACDDFAPVMLRLKNTF